MQKNKSKNRKKPKKHNHARPDAVLTAQGLALSAKGGSIYNEQAIYRRNMHSLQQRYPQLVQRVSMTQISSYRIVPAGPGGLPNLYLPATDTFYYEQSDPVKDVRQQLEALKLKNTRLAVFLGLGLGYQVLHFAQNLAKEQNTNYLLIIEKDLQIFKAALKSVDIVPLLENPGIQFMVGFSEESLYPELRNYLAENSRFMLLTAMKPVYHPSALILHKDYYLNALKQLRESGTHQVLNFGNDPHDSLIGVENMLRNIEEIVFNPGINLLYHKFKGKPAVVVATGPSLNKNKHLLQGLEGRALIICVDASLKILLEMGVKPHLVTSLERVPAVLKLIAGVKKEEVENVYFAACPVICHEVYQAYPGPRIIVYRNFDHFKWLGIERGILNIQLSAGNMAFKVAEALGCDPIVLIGQDLAFSRDGDTHARGTALGEKQDYVFNDNILEVMGNDGRPIRTTSTWYSFLKAYEVDLAAYKGRCINSTEGGAYINATEVMPFREAIESYMKAPFAPLEIIRESIASFTKGKAEEDFHHVLELIRRTTADMQGMIESCRLGLQLYERYKDDLHEYLASPQQINPFRKKPQQLSEEMLAPKHKCISQYHQSFQLFFMHIFQSFNIKFEMEMIALPEKFANKETAAANLLLRHQEWYLVVTELAQVCIKALAKAKEQLEQKIAVNTW